MKSSSTRDLPTVWPFLEEGVGHATADDQEEAFFRRLSRRRSSRNLGAADNGGHRLRRVVTIGIEDFTSFSIRKPPTLRRRTSRFWRGGVGAVGGPEGVPLT
jgi:hypothetical protein